MSLVTDHIRLAASHAHALWPGRGLAQMERDDYVQSAMLGLCEAAQRYKAGKAAFPSFAYRRIRGAVRDAERQAYYGPRYSPVPVVDVDNVSLSTADTAIDAAIDADGRRVLAAALRALPRRLRSTVWRYYWRDMTQAQIAAQDSVVESAISIRLKKAHQLMREAMK